MADKISVQKQEAYQALDLLQQYYNRLNSPEDSQLKHAIDRVIKIFKSRLFQALIEIQEFYETTLLDEHSDLQTKMKRTHNFADEWERQSMFENTRQNGVGTASITTTDRRLQAVESVVTENPTIQSTSTKQNSSREPTLTPFARVAHKPEPIAPPSSTIKTTTVESNQYNYADHWKDIEIVLTRSPPGAGLGFSIAGGKNTPCISKSSAVVVTRITQNGVAARDRRLKLYDIILRVNDIDFTDIEHETAVNTLKATGNEVKLLVRRLAPQSAEEIELIKPPNVHLGFSIAGGTTHEHVKGDHGIFVTNIIPGSVVDKSGLLRLGDRLMSVISAENTYDLEFVEHKHAVEAIRRAGTEGDKIILVVAHPTNYPNSFSSSLINPTTENNNRTANISDRTEVPADNENKELPDERRVLLRRGPNGFGINIISNNTHEGIFISNILPSGPAEKSGLLRRGDRILSVNNIDLSKVSQEHAANVLKNCGDTAHLHVYNDYNEFARVENYYDENRPRKSNDMSGSTGSLKVSTNKQFYVRTQFDYDASKDPNLPGTSGLSFHSGDILYITNSADDNWWQAKRINSHGDEEGEAGIIPSKSRIEKRERAKLKHVNFNQESNSRNNTLDREKKKKKKINVFSRSDKKDTQSGEDSELDAETSEPVLSYEPVVKHTINYSRPIVIFGPFKEVLNDQLISDEPNRFANCVPHTSRPKREREVDGREYHFVSTREEMERDIQNYLFIEAGEYGGNLYGTSVRAVREVAIAGKHCVLDVSGHAIKRLITANLYPIVIFIKPPNAQWILDNMGQEDANEKDAYNIFDRATNIEEQFHNFFTTSIQENNLNDVYDRVCEIIDKEESVSFAWVPSKDKI